MAVADAYDALISRRVHKPGMSHEMAVDIIRQGGGWHFDPDVCDTLLAAREQFHAIAKQFTDSEEDMAKQQASLAPVAQRNT